MTVTSDRALSPDQPADVMLPALQCVGVELASRDPESLARFYVGALAFSYVNQNEAGVDLQLGQCLLRLRRARGRSMPTGSRSHDRWFRHLAIVVKDMAQAHEHVQTLSPPEISSDPQTLPAWNEASGGIEAFYFRDPEGHPLELVHFPADKGRPQWHRAGRDLFQGVDHSAIVVASASVSVAFYNDLAGLTTIACAHNYGPEQERLSSVDGANLHATSLGNAQTRAPSLELLEYATPLDGRVMPPDTCRDDLWWSASILARDPDEARLRAVGNATQSPEWVDPDGYRVVML